jgi:hypothetical protein
MTDEKIGIIYDNYRHLTSASNLPAKVEKLRKKASMYGVGASFALFLGNEVSRFTFRSPLFKLRPIPIILVAIGPTAILKYLANGHVDAEVLKFWRIHKTREEHGFGGSYKPESEYSFHIPSVRQEERFPVFMHYDSLIAGTRVQPLPFNPNARLNKAWMDFPDFHDDLDRGAVATELVESKRMKMFAPKKGAAKGTWFIRSPVDDDSVSQWGGIDNDYLYHEPPDSRLGPQYDAKLDEKKIFNFRISPFGNHVIDNLFILDPDTAVKDTGMPWWHKKLITPAYYNDESMREAVRQMFIINEFNLLKAKHALNASSGSRSIADVAKETKEINSFIDKAQERTPDDIFVTDHSPNPKKLHTNSLEEDIDFFNYEQKLKEFHTNSPTQAMADGEKMWKHPMVELREKTILKANALLAEKAETDGDEEGEGEEEVDNEELQGLLTNE